MKKYKDTVLKIINYLIIFLSTIVALFGFLLAFVSNVHLGNTGVIILFGLPMLIELINIVIQSSFCNDEKKIKAIRRQNIYVILIIYILALINLLFVGSIYRSYSFVYDNITYSEYIKESVNIIPFKTMYTYAERMINHTINTNIVLMNIFGNLILLMPLIYILPQLFKEKIIEKKKIIIVILSISILIEVLQLILKVGKVDIDDVILNTFGAIIFYEILQIKHIKNLLIKFKIYNSAEKE